MDGSKEASLYDKTRFAMVKTAIMKTLCQDHKAVPLSPDRFTVPEVNEDDAHEGLVDSIRDGYKTVKPQLLQMNEDGTPVPKRLMMDNCTITGMEYTDKEWLTAATENQAHLDNQVDLAQQMLAAHAQLGEQQEGYADEQERLQQGVDNAGVLAQHWARLLTHVKKYHGDISFYKQANMPRESDVTKAKHYLKLEVANIITTVEWDRFPAWKRFYLYKYANAELFSVLSAFMGRNYSATTVYLKCDLGDGLQLWKNICSDAMKATVANRTRLLQEYQELRMYRWETYPQYYKRVMDAKEAYEQAAGKTMDVDLTYINLAMNERLPNRYNALMEMFQYNSPNADKYTDQQKLALIESLLARMIDFEAKEGTAKQIEHEVKKASGKGHWQRQKSKRRGRKQEKAHAANQGGMTQTCTYCRKHFPNMWTNHTEADCRNKKAGATGTSGKKHAHLDCHNCGTKGHIAKDCPDLKNAKRLQNAHKNKGGKSAMETAVAAMQAAMGSLDKEEQYQLFKRAFKVAKEQRP